MGHDSQSYDFDPYVEWLGIESSGAEEPDHFRLLGLQPNVSDGQLIAFAAEKANEKIRKHSLGKQGELAEKLLNQIARAEAILTNPAKRGKYLERLKRATRSDAQSSDRTQSDSKSTDQSKREVAAVIDTGNTDATLPKDREIVSPNNAAVQASLKTGPRVKVDPQESQVEHDGKIQIEQSTDTVKVPVEAQDPSAGSSFRRLFFAVACILGLVFVATRFFWVSSSPITENGKPTVVEPTLDVEPEVIESSLPPTEFAIVGGHVVEEGADFQMVLPTISPLRPGEEFVLIKAPDGMTIDPTSGALDWKPSESDEGEFEITIAVAEKSDGSEITRTSFLLTVNSVITPPEIHFERQSVKLDPGKSFSMRISIDVDQDSTKDDYELRCKLIGGKGRPELLKLKDGSGDWSINWEAEFEKFGTKKTIVPFEISAVYRKNSEIYTAKTFNVTVNKLIWQEPIESMTNEPIVDMDFDAFSHRLISYDQSNSINIWRLPKEIGVGSVSLDQSLSVTVPGMSIDASALQWLGVFGVGPATTRGRLQSANYQESDSVMVLSYYAETELKDNRKELRILLGKLTQNHGESIGRVKIVPGKIPAKARSKRLENIMFPEMFNYKFLAASNKRIFAFDTISETLKYGGEFFSPNIGFVKRYNWFAKGGTTIGGDSIVDQGLLEGKDDNTETSLSKLPWEIKEGDVIRALEYESVFALLLSNRRGANDRRLFVLKDRGKTITELKSEREFVDVAFVNYLVVTGDNTGELAFFDIETPTSPILKLNLDSPIVRIVTSYHSANIAVGFEDGTIKIINAALLPFDSQKKKTWAKKYFERGEKAILEIVGRQSFSTTSFLLKMTEPFYQTATELDPSNPLYRSKLFELRDAIQQRMKSEERQRRLP